MSARFALGLVGLTIVGIGCRAPETPGLEDQVAKAVIASAGSGGTESVAPATLAEIVPEELLGMRKVDYSNQKTAAGGFEMTVVSARYQDGGRRIQLTVTDAPSGGPALAAANAWTMGTFDRTTASGYQRTAVIDGFRGYEEFDARRERTTVSAFIANRFIFNVRGDKISMDELKRAVGEFGLRRLGRLGGE